MKQFKMPDRKEPPRKKLNPKSSPSDSAFDKWLNRGLHELFDDAINEPIPPEMLKLLKPDSEASEKPAQPKEDDVKK